MTRIYGLWSTNKYGIRGVHIFRVPRIRAKSKANVVPTFVWTANHLWWLSLSLRYRLKGSRRVDEGVTIICIIEYTVTSYTDIYTYCGTCAVTWSYYDCRVCLRILIYTRTQGVFAKECFESPKRVHVWKTRRTVGFFPRHKRFGRVISWTPKNDISVHFCARSRRPKWTMILYCRSTDFQNRIARVLLWIRDLICRDNLWHHLWLTIIYGWPSDWLVQLKRKKNCRQYTSYY